MPAVATTGVSGKPAIRTYAAGAVNIGRGLAVVQGASDAQAIQAANANVPCLGLANEATTVVGQPLGVVYHGEAVGIAGAAIVAPAFLVTNAAGQLIPSAAIGDQVIGRAVSSAAVAGDELVVFVNPFTR